MFENVGTYVSTVRVELLERETALETLAEAHAAAARGNGRAVGISGEPGIGKTSLVRRFLDDLDDGARVLLGTCDDLSIARPLGPFRDLAGERLAGLEDALAAGAAPHEIQDLLIQELERRRGQPCSCSRTCTGPTTRRSTRSPCSAAGSAPCRRCS